MTVLRHTQVIRRPVEEVFAVVVDGAAYETWNPTVRRSRRLDDGELGEGSRFEWRLKGFGDVVQELQEFERDRRVRIVPHVKSLGGGHRFVLTPTAEGTRIDHELEMIPKGAFRLLGPIVGVIGRKNLRDTAAALQNHLEGESKAADLGRD